MNVDAKHGTIIRQWMRASDVICPILVAVVTLGFSNQLRADHIDEELIKKAPELVKALQAKGYKSVGVLKFMVKAGKSPVNPNIGPLNLLMATRVENALIHGDTSSIPLGVIRDATKVAAAADSAFTTKTEAGRSALLKLHYPLAWGSDKVVADALLTGLVSLSHDMRKVTVEIDCFDRKSNSQHKLMTFQVPSDRNILADAGRSFVLTSRSISKSKKRSIEELDQDAADSATLSSDGTSVTQQATDSVPIRFEIKYYGTVQAISADPGSFGEMRVDTPHQGDAVTFHVTNTTKDKIGLVLKVNGESTLGQDSGENSVCQKWILAPGQAYGLRGFYTYPENKLAVFKVLSDEDSAARMAEWSGSRPRAGYIDVTVFTPGPAESTDMTYGRTLRGLTRPGGKSSHPKSAAEARSLIHSQVGSHTTKKKSRGLVVAGDQKEDANLHEDQADNLLASFQLQINYYKPGP